MLTPVYGARHSDAPFNLKYKAAMMQFCGWHDAQYSPVLFVMTAFLMKIIFAFFIVLSISSGQNISIN